MAFESDEVMYLYFILFIYMIITHGGPLPLFIFGLLDQKYYERSVSPTNAVREVRLGTHNIVKGLLGLSPINIVRSHKTNLEK